MNTPARWAIKTTLLSEQNFKVGAVLAQKNKIFSLAANTGNSHPRGAGTFQSSHAEIRCLLKYLRLNQQTLPKAMLLYVARVSKTGVLGLARPCHDCMTMIQSVGIKKIWYTTSEGWRSEKFYERHH